MSYMDQFTPVELGTSGGGGAKTWDKIVEDAVENQKKINKGDEVKNGSGNPIPSWFKDGMCRPKIWISYLFDSKGYPMTQEQYDGFLEAMSDWKNDSFLKECVDKLEMKKLETDRKARESRATSQAKKKEE